MNVKLKNKFLLLFIVYMVVQFMGCNPSGQHEKISAPYSISHKLTRPVVFSDDKITTTNGICFSNDGNTLYTSGQINKQFENGKYYMGVFVSRFQNGTWTEQKQLQLPTDIDAYHPVLSANNDVLYINSRSHPNSASLSIPHNIWKVKISSDGCGIPVMVKNVNSATNDSYPSIAVNNNMYFNSDREGGLGGMDIYVARFVDGSYQQPVNLQLLNSSDVENDLVIDPYERFIIFNRYVSTTQEIDLFISFNQNNQWTKPRELDNINVAGAWELTPSLSPDLKYFFYELEHKIMQIDLGALIYDHELKGIGTRSFADMTN